MCFQNIHKACWTHDGRIHGARTAGGIGVGSPIRRCPENKLHRPPRLLVFCPAHRVAPRWRVPREFGEARIEAAQARAVHALACGNITQVEV